MGRTIFGFLGPAGLRTPSFTTLQVWDDSGAGLPEAGPLSDLGLLQ